VSDSYVAPGVDAGITPLTRQEFEQIRQLAYSKFGLALHDGKEHLVSARLSKQIRNSPFKSFREYYKHVVDDTTGQALAAMIDALTTNFTSFFREPDHFEFLRTQIVPAWEKRATLPVWSAACATGEEPYSIAVCLLEMLGASAEGRLRILATDISNKALNTAKAATYPVDRFSTFSPELLRRYVMRGKGKCEGWYRFNQEVTGKVEFQRLNLIEPFSHRDIYPLIFCRNVMIYFDKATQTDLVNRLAMRLEPGGHLFIGHSESLNGIDCPLKYVKPAIYRRVP
jgi:chemotaxis protein methyltransferase CheR